MEQRTTDAPHYARHMSFEQRKFLVLSSWVACVMVVGIIMTIDKPDLWILVATAAVLPAVVGSWLWNAPQVTLSQLIQRYRK